ncbi:hypothetical protein B296_00040647 [Ensete ventricosum]|uniref:Uncharacterized protein n=1 Tax=Ensete ventricosum TaxID=4639 RepID=A0A426YE22_ENSVE|nr:hypothetical protein B296_00040647 [Ensete ventricosum]
MADCQARSIGCLLGRGGQRAYPATICQAELVDCYSRPVVRSAVRPSLSVVRADGDYLLGIVPGGLDQAISSGVLLPKIMVGRPIFYMSVGVSIGDLVSSGQLNLLAMFLLISPMRSMPWSAWSTSDVQEIPAKDATRCTPEERLKEDVNPEAVATTKHRASEAQSQVENLEAELEEARRGWELAEKELNEARTGMTDSHKLLNEA